MRTLGLVILLAACSHPAPLPTSPRPPPPPHATLSANVQDWLAHGTEPTLAVVFGITDEARVLVRELGLELDGDYGGALAATVTRAQLARLAASAAITDIRRNFAIGLPPAALDADVSWWLQESITLDTCQPTDGTATVFVEIDHEPSATERTVLDAAGVILDDGPHDPIIVTARLTRTAVADVARAVPGVRISLMPCMQLYD